MVPNAGLFLLAKTIARGEYLSSSNSEFSEFEHAPR